MTKGLNSRIDIKGILASLLNTIKLRIDIRISARSNLAHQGFNELDSIALLFILLFCIVEFGVEVVYGGGGELVAYFSHYGNEEIGTSECSGDAGEGRTEDVSAEGTLNKRGRI